MYRPIIFNISARREQYITDFLCSLSVFTISYAILYQQQTHEYQNLILENFMDFMDFIEDFMLVEKAHSKSD